MNDEGDEEQREMVGLKGLERFWGLDDNPFIIITAAEKFENLHRNRKIKFYGKHRGQYRMIVFPPSAYFR